MKPSEKIEKILFEYQRTEDVSFEKKSKNIFASMHWDIPTLTPADYFAAIFEYLDNQYEVNLNE